MDFKVNFHDGAKLEYGGSPSDPPIYVEFKDLKTNKIVYTATIDPNCWCQSNLKYYVEWQISAYAEGKLVYRHIFDLKGKRVLIEYPYSTLGDFLLWLPAFELFRKTHECHLIVETRRYIDIVSKSYPDIIFTTSRTPLINDGIYAFYYPNLQEYDQIFRNTYPKYNTTQQAAAEYLGLNYYHIRPKVDSDDIVPDIKKPYVCMTEFGRSNVEKDWLYPGGWQIIVDYLNRKGYGVAVVSFEPTKLKNIIDLTGKPLKETIRYIKNADLFIGAATGLPVIALALRVKTLQICTNVWPDNDMDLTWIYNHEPNTCFGCYTKEPKPFGSSCHTRIDGIPECSMTITPELVIENIEKILSV